MVSCGTWVSIESGVEFIDRSKENVENFVTIWFVVQSVYKER